MSADAHALDGLHVVELVDQPVEYCGRLLAGLGADVVKLEPPEGAPSRHVGPYVDGREGDVDASLSFWHFNVGKRSVVASDDRTTRRVCASADVVIHTLGSTRAAELGLDHASLESEHPGLISCAITPFGLTGPWADYLADDLVLMALGGSMAVCGYGTDDPPLACWGDQAWLTAATYGAIAVLAALDHRDRTGAGQLIDVSAHQASASMTEWHVMTYLCTGSPMARFRHPTVTARDGKQVAALIPDFLGPHVFAHFLALLEADGVAGPLSDPAFEDPRHRARGYGELMAATQRLADRHDGEELFRLGQEAGLPWGVIRAPDETLDDRHLRARGHFVEIDGVTHSGAPIVANGSPFRFDRPPPRLGEHTDDVLKELPSMTIPVGVLYDFPQGDGGRYFEDGLRLGFSEQRVPDRLGEEISLVARQADGLPAGSAESVIESFNELVALGVVAIAGPSISDNGLIVRDLADEAGIACINYTGGAFTRGRHMFHYQVGSLEEEPVLLAEHLLARGHHRIAVLYDDTPVGTSYDLWLGRAVARTGDPELAFRGSVSPLAEDLRADVEAALVVEPDALLYLGLGVAARAVALGVEAVGWTGPVVTNSALMFGYARPDWRRGFEDWVYVDTISDGNPVRAALRERSRMHAASPIGVAAFDIGRLLGEGIVLADDRTPAAVREGLERVKRLPAATGKSGTTMGFGDWDHGALKGEALVLRAWRGGRTVEVD